MLVRVSPRLMSRRRLRAAARWWSQMLLALTPRCGTRRLPLATSLRRQRTLRHARRTVRDQPHRPPRHLDDRRAGRRPLLGDLLAPPLHNSLGHGELGPHLGQLLGQLFLEFVQLRTSGGDPLHHLGLHTADRRSGPGNAGREFAKPPLPDDLHPRLPPATSASTPDRATPAPVTSQLQDGGASLMPLILPRSMRMPSGASACGVLSAMSLPLTGRLTADLRGSSHRFPDSPN